MARHPQFKWYPAMPQGQWSGLRWEHRQYGWIQIPTIYKEESYRTRKEYRQARFSWFAHIGRKLYKPVLKNYMPYSRLVKPYGMYMKLAITINTDSMLDRTFMNLWNGTLPVLSFVKNNYDLIIQGYEITWPEVPGLNTISDLRVFAFAFNIESGAVYPAGTFARVWEKRIEVQCPDVDSVPGWLMFAFLYRVYKGRVMEISPCSSMWGTGWQWLVQHP